MYDCYGIIASATISRGSIALRVSPIGDYELVYGNCAILVWSDGNAGNSHDEPSSFHSAYWLTAFDFQVRCPSALSFVPLPPEDGSFSQLSGNWQSSSRVARSLSSKEKAAVSIYVQRRRHPSKITYLTRCEHFLEIWKDHVFRKVFIYSSAARPESDKIIRQFYFLFL